MKVDPDSDRLRLRMEPCCPEWADVIMMNDFRQGVIRNDDGTYELWWDDCDCTPLRFCPCCGKRIREAPE